VHIAVIGSVVQTVMDCIVGTECDFEVGIEKEIG